MSVKVQVKYADGSSATFPMERNKTFADLAEKIKTRIRNTGEGLLPGEQDDLSEDQSKGNLGFIRSFSLKTSGEEVYPAKQNQEIRKYAEDGEVLLTATFHYEGGSLH